MSKDKIQLLSPLFLKYQSDFEKNPRSRVFAPLAETYRKLGMTDKAMEILSQGIRFHPTYVMGYLGLAFCYFDLKQYHLAYTTLRPLTENHRDNLRLLKLFADVCLELAKTEEALETLKYLLFINPKDKVVAGLVVELEKEVEERYRPQHRPIVIDEKELTHVRELKADSKEELFELDILSPSNIKKSDRYDDWMTVDLNQESKLPADQNEKIHTSPEVTSYDHWNVKKINQVHEVISSPFVPDSKDDVEDLRTYDVPLELERESDLDEHLETQSKKEVSAPIVTHTLVDLYCGQGHIDKALEVLEKILLLNPKDTKTINKIKELKTLVQPSEFKIEEIEEIEDLEDLEDLEDASEEDGRRHLMNLIDEKIGPIEVAKLDVTSERADSVRLIEEKLSLFLKKIQKRALDYQGRI